MRCCSFAAKREARVAGAVPGGCPGVRGEDKLEGRDDACAGMCQAPATTHPGATVLSHPEAAGPDRAGAARFPPCRAGHVGFPNVQLALGFPGGGTRPCPWLRVEGVGSTRGPTLLASSEQH